MEHTGNLPLNDEDISHALTTSTGASALGIDELIRCGCTNKEITALLQLLHQYQTDGGDRGAVKRHWEFLKLLVQSGRMEV